MPSMIHEELKVAGLIPDFHLGLNEELVQWVGEAEWIYRCEFELDRLPEDGEAADLVFEGLDTFATVFLNGKKVLESSNMFLSHRVSALPSLRRGLNTLYLTFHSSFLRGRELEERALGRAQHWPCWNGDPSRLFVRKAGYGYGWDWGPCVVTAGPYRPVRLEVYRSRIIDFWPRAHVSDSLEASLSLSWTVSDDTLPGLAAAARLVSPRGVALRKTSFEGAACAGEHVWRLDGEGEVELWWAAGMGEQPLYEVAVDLVDMHTGAVLDSVSRKVGFRRLRVVRAPLDDPAESGRTFLFELNGVPLFVGGSNWIPIDSVVTNASRDRYRRWLELAREGNQTMVRVWGGGLYEDEAFYEGCDELGLLVWQDLMFACGSYPAHLPDFRASVETEVTQVVKRLRSHACVALIAGNNEDYQIAEAEGLEYDPTNKDGDWLRTNFPARELYERTFPRIVSDYSDVFYWPGSPWAGKSTRDLTEGDVHVWDVWHGSQEPYQDYHRLGGRFVSEFGMEGAPDVGTIDYFLDGDTSQLFPQSRTLDAHNKAAGHERRLALYVTENIRSGTTLEDYVYATQFVQAEAMASAFGGWRRKFEGGVGGAKCAGALVWQLNDVWPTTSWSIVDFFLRPKPAYFAIKRTLAPMALGARRYTVRRFPDRFSAAEHIDETFVDLWASNMHLSRRRVVIEVEAFELRSGRRVHREKREVELGENRSTELQTLEVPSAWEKEDAVVIAARLVEPESEEVLARVSVYPEPFKYLSFPSPSDVNLRITLHRSRSSSSTGEIRVAADRPVKGLVLRTSTDTKLSDNFLDLVPRDEQVVRVDGLEKETKLEWRYLGDEHCP
ncbi:beta-mannosidase [Rhodotorula diobovata]|uniref:beta-mannosidase n=1 Tax=Rhodotorula diobovata TaxID=5288 RepID=A0A5C5FPR8_9BASI|nr:beta-mannosidase [Rhodotorula diobovata]